MAKRTVIAPDEELLIKGKLVIQGNVTQIETTQLVNRLESNSLVINSDGDAVTAQLILNSDNELAVIGFNSATGNIEVSKTIQGNIYIPDGATLSGNTFSGNASAADSLTSSVTISLSGDATGSNTFISAGTTTTVPVTLSTVNSNVGVFGNSDNVASINVSAKGLVTAVTPVPISILSSQVSNFNAAVSAYINTDAFLTESNGVISLNNTTVVAGSYGAANSALTLSINSKGQITSAVANSISILASQVSDFNTASNTAVDARIVGGDGLTYTSGNLNVGAGDGINVDADNVSVDSTVVRTDSDATLGNNYTFTGTLDATAAISTASTQANTDNSTKIATTAYVKTVINDLVNGANTSLDTLREIADALANNTNIGTIVLNNESNIATLQGRNISAGDGLSGGGNLSADVTLNVGAGDGIIVDADNVSVDSTVVRTTGDQTITGNTTFVGTLVIPNSDATANGAIFTRGPQVFANVAGIERELTPAVDVGDVEDVGDTGINIYAGFRIDNVGNANIVYHGIKSIDAGNLLTISEASNVISIAGDSAAITGLISTSNVSGFGGLTYNSTTGVISHVGVSTAEIRNQISGTGLIAYSTSTGVISTTADNYNSWKFTTGSEGNTDVASGDLVTFFAGDGIQITHDANSTITITNISSADITGVSAGNGLTGGGESGDVTLTVGAGDGITVNADNVALTSGIVTAAAQSGGISAITVDTFGRVTSVTANAGFTTNTGTVTSVGGTGTVSGLTLTGTVTTSGSLTLGGTLAVTASDFASQTTKTFLAAPNASNGVPTFRTIVASDVPTLNQNTTGSAATLTTARTIGGVSFDGSTNINLPGVNTAGNQNTSGTAAGLSATLVATSGGTGQSVYAVGDILFASTTTALSKLADVATGSALISGGVGVAPSYGKIGLTTHVSGTLPVANGGTGVTTSTGTGAVVLGTSPTFTTQISVPSIVKTGTSGTGNIGQAANSFNTVFAKATSAQYADLAEKYLADSQYEPGTVLVFGGKYEVTVTDSELNHRVAGVVTTTPAHLMNDQLSGEFVVDVALRGRVPCKVVGKVQKGDVLVTSNVTGYARAAEHPQFTGGACVVGKAITEKTDSGLGVVEALI